MMLARSSCYTHLSLWVTLLLVDNLVKFLLFDSQFSILFVSLRPKKKKQKTRSILCSAEDF